MSCTKNIHTNPPTYASHKNELRLRSHDAGTFDLQAVNLSSYKQLFKK